MEGTRRLAVLIPAYNAERFLAETLDGLLAQTFSDFSVIVVDDASTDGTRALAEAYAARDDRIRVLANERNLGIAGTRNRLVAEATEELIAWQDSDDISLPARLEHQVAFLDAHPEVGIVGGWLEFFGAGRTSVRRYAEADAEARGHIFRYMPVAQPAAMLRRELVLRAGPYESCFEPAEDLDMAFRLGRITRFGNVQEVVIRYRESATSATRSRLRKIETDTLRLRLRHARTPDYRARPADWAFNLAQAATLYALPPRLRIELFNRIRNA